MTAPKTSVQDFTTKAYFFGEFVLDLERGCLVREGSEIKLRPKSYELLRYLVERHGRLFSKEELIQAVWPDSFVTDDSLVQCVMDIRRALDDQSQRYVKTVPKRGYIFQEPVSFKNGSATGTIDTSATDGATIMPEEAKSDGTVLPPPAPQQVWQQSGAHSAWRRIAVGLLALVGGLAWYPRPTSVTPAWESVRLTSYPGVERNPALSPDSNTVAFIWNGEAPGNFDIYTLAIGSTRPQRLTTDPAEDTSPAWSPDGKTIAFLRRLNAERSQLILIPATGGRETVLTEIRIFVLRGTAGSTLRSNLAWTPDGQWIAVPHWENDESPNGLSLVSVLTGSKRSLTQPPAGYFDENPAFSRDGSMLAFARHPGVRGSDLYLQPLSEDFAARAPLKHLTTNGQSSQPAWTSDGRQIIYIVSAKGGPLQTIAVSTPGLPGRVLLEDRIADFSLGQHLVYSVSFGAANVWRAEIRSPEGLPVTPQLFISSTGGENNPRFSPDGKKIAFISYRSGSSQLWISDADGANAVEVTSPVGALSPNWSPDSVNLVFHARIGGQAGNDVFSIPAAGGSLKQLTTEPSDDVLASYSRDGHWIYFTSSRSGQPEIWKVPVAGGDATRMTDGGAILPLESWDGKTLFYAHLNPEKGIWRIPVRGGDAEQVTGPIAKDPAFAVGTGGIYYVSPPETPTRQLIWFLSFSTRQSRPVVVANREVGLGLSLSPDERYLIFAQRDGNGSDLMLIKDFVPPR